VPFYSRCAKLSLLIVFASVIAGCIQPVEETPATTPTAPLASVGEDQPPAADALPPAEMPTLSSGEPITEPPAPVDAGTLVTEFIMRRGDSPSNLNIWTEQQLGPDLLHAFVYSGAAGEPCGGFLLSAVPGAPSDNGAIACAEDPAAGVFAGMTLLLTSDGQPFSIIFGQVFDPTIAAVTATYADGTINQTQPVEGGFLIATPGIAELSSITAQDPSGNTIIQQIPQSAVR